MGGDSFTQGSPGYRHTTTLIKDSPSGGINTITCKLEGLTVTTPNSKLEGAIYTPLDGLRVEGLKDEELEEGELKKEEKVGAPDLLKLTGSAYGDGDQSPVYGSEADTLLTKWCSGLDYNPEHNKTLSSWCKLCYVGDVEGLVSELEQCTSGLDLPELCRATRDQLLDKRESQLRFPALLHVICGARQHPSIQHVECVKVLLRHNADTTARDIAGNTPLHHCMTLYGNSITLEIAELLVKAGADINAQNRVGRTPLFEPCANSNHQFIKFLVEAGAKTNLTDNSGLSCQAFTGASPALGKSLPMHKIFSDGYIAQAKRERPVGECLYCHSEETLKKCSGCLTVSYCSKQCQRDDWRHHKPSCVMDKSGVIDVHPVSNPYTSLQYEAEAIHMFNVTNNGVYSVTGCMELDKTLPRNIVVKIQVPLGANGASKNGPMYVYNRDRSYRLYIPTTDVNYDKVHSVVVEKGYGGIKAYFCACLQSTGVLSVNINNVFNETW